MSTLHDDRVRARAFEIWEAEGRPVGHDLEHWLAAERELMQEKRGNGEVDAAKPAKAPRKRQSAAAAPGAANPTRTTRKKKEIL